MVDEARRCAPDAQLLATHVQSLQVEMQAKNERLRILDTLTDVTDWFNAIKAYGTIGYLCLNCADRLHPSPGRSCPPERRGGPSGGQIAFHPRPTRGRKAIPSKPREFDHFQSHFFDLSPASASPTAFITPSNPARHPGAQGEPAPSASGTYAPRRTSGG